MEGRKRQKKNQERKGLSERKKKQDKEGKRLNERNKGTK